MNKGIGLIKKSKYQIIPPGMGFTNFQGTSHCPSIGLIKLIGEGLMRFDFHMITFPFTLLAIRFYKYLTISLLSSMAFYYIKQHASK
jgi:hypothetical protein